MVKLNSCDRNYITKLRCSNLKIPIETGRWYGVPKNERICHLCRNGIGDEFHYLFKCQKPELVAIRNKFIPHYYVNNPREYKLTGLLLYCHVELYNNLAKFIKLLIRFI